MHHYDALLHLSPSNFFFFPDQYELDMDHRDAICSHTVAKMASTSQSNQRNLLFI
jgi:hypothetical protein